MIWRFMGAIAAVVLLALVVQDVPLAGYLRDVERNRIVTSLQRDAFLLGGRSAASLTATPPDADGSITALAKAYRSTSGARVVITDGAGVAIVTSDDDTGAVGSSFVSRPEIASALSGIPVDGTRYSSTLGFSLLYVAVPVHNGASVIGTVRLTYPASVVDDAVNAKLLGFGLVGLVSVLIAGLLGYLLSRGVSRPVRMLRAATDLLATGDLTARADEAAGAPELRRLSRGFNTMAGRLDGLLAQQRAFAGDVSHQLRTPLTALRLRLERARELATSDPEAAVARIEAGEAELDRLEALIEGLLALSRAEGADAAAVPVDLQAVAAERVASWAALAEESGRSVVLSGPAARVRAVPGAVEQIIDNLVDNALSLSPADGTVEVVLRPAADAVALHVRDRGPGMSEPDRARAFDRFWRGRTAGMRDGSGLGLAIVAQLARASGATAELHPRDGGGLDAVVRFARA